MKAGVSSGGNVAEQLEFFPVPSPCCGICQADDRGYCRGCLRTRDERFNWSHFSDMQKREVLRLCRQRYLRLHKRSVENADDKPEQPSLF